MVKVTFVKIGYIATTTLIDALLDERGGRKDLQMRVVSSSVSMEEEASVDVAKMAAGIPSDLYVVVSPNAAMPGPTKAREALRATGKPVIVVSDEPSRKTLKENPVEGVGYIVVTNDPMIGAKQSFLDPVEMALFNADAIRVLAVTGSFRIVQQEIDKVIEQIGRGEKPTLPQVVIEKENGARRGADIEPLRAGQGDGRIRGEPAASPTSAQRAHSRSRNRRDTSQSSPRPTSCSGRRRRPPTRQREMEKGNDSAARLAHFSKGETRKKTKLGDKFEK